MIATLKSYWPLLPALALYAFLADHLNFTQDDAYITYRYVANFLNGDGLVFNIGERIEGITNFGWAVYLILWGKLGLDFIFISKITGFLCGAGVVIMTFLIAREVFEGRALWFAAAATLLLAFNQSLAYWSPAGLETAAFAFLAMLSLWLYLKRNRLLIFSIAVAVWVRPEGALLAGLLLFIEAVQTKTWPRFTLGCVGVAFVLSLPMVAFKLIYYGSILPNPFYAKTSFTIDQLQDGLEYAGRFFGHYGFWGIGFILPLVFFKRLSSEARAVWLFALLYTAYIVLIGGDVLKVHRFFLPVFGPSAILLVLSLWLLIGKLKRNTRYVILLVVTLGLVVNTYNQPKAYIDKYLAHERGFTEKMQTKARQLKASDSTNFSVAVATIGMFGYELLGHDIIDLLGLTDSTIARYSEDPIPGMVTTWKEQKHNSRYLLEKAPDYIVFSTGIKPSAPAERALLLYRQFMDSYRTLGWYYPGSGSGGHGIITIIFKKTHPIEGEIVPVYPVEYVQKYKEGLEAISRGDFEGSVPLFEEAQRISPEPDYIYLDQQRAFSLMMIGRVNQAKAAMDSILVRDSTVFEAHSGLYRIETIVGSPAKAEIHKRWLLKLVPWYFGRIERTTADMKQRFENRR